MAMMKTLAGAWQGSVTTDSPAWACLATIWFAFSLNLIDGRLVY
jgi:hypothetical protein